ncbi:MAG: hypothetical protein P4M11_00140 [Candidatus Pacebacteria bacterium]|nr:hypothetical protein [Candidatus Paceibacterota bacterium]
MGTSFTRSVSTYREKVGVDLFRSDTSDLWKKCDCVQFEEDFKMSSRYYFAIAVGMGGIALLHFIVGLCFCCSKPRSDLSEVVPANESSH